MFPTFKRDVLEIALEAQRIGQGINLKTESFHTKVRLLEVDIPLGLASWQVTGILEMPVEELEQTLMALDSEDGIEIELFVMDGVGEFSNWLPNNIEDS